MKKETEAERVAETMAALKARAESAEEERDSLLRSIESWKREEKEWEKERAGWLGTLDKSEHEGMMWKDRAEVAETQRNEYRESWEKACDIHDSIIAERDKYPSKTPMYVCNGCGREIEHPFNGGHLVEICHPTWCGPVEQRRKG